jgi:hypothetical protein
MDGMMPSRHHGNLEPTRKSSFWQEKAISTRNRNSANGNYLGRRGTLISEKEAKSF